MTRAEETRRAQLWEPWLGPALNASLKALPWEVNWPVNPDAPPPPGYVWARCLCYVTVVRPPDWHGQQRDKRGRLRYGLDPAATYRHWDVHRSVWKGSVCELRPHPDDPSRTIGCGAPLQRIEHRNDPYPWPFDLAESLARQAGRPRALGAVPSLMEGSVPTIGQPSDSRLVVQAPGVTYRKPPPLERWSRFPSAAAERAWVAAERRQGRRVS